MSETGGETQSADDWYKTYVKAHKRAVKAETEIEIVLSFLRSVVALVDANPNVYAGDISNTRSFGEARAYAKSNGLEGE